MFLVYMQRVADFMVNDEILQFKVAMGECVSRMNAPSRERLVEGWVANPNLKF